jgi:hypothetical protein
MGNKTKIVIFILAVASLLIACYVTMPRTDFLTKYEVITLKGGTFDLDVKVLITDDTVFAAKYIHENNGAIVEPGDLDARGSTFGTLQGSTPIIWLPTDFTVPVANHELFHASINLMQWAGIPLHDNTEEAYAYEMQQLSNEFYNQIKPTK